MHSNPAITDSSICFCGFCAHSILAIWSLLNLSKQCTFYDAFSKGPSLGQFSKDRSSKVSEPQICWQNLLIFQRTVRDLSKIMHATKYGYNVRGSLRPISVLETFRVICQTILRHNRNLHAMRVIKYANHEVFFIACVQPTELSRRHFLLPDKRCTWKSKFHYLKMKQTLNVQIEFICSKFSLLYRSGGT